MTTAETQTVPFDPLSPSDFPGREKKIHYFDAIPSTMDVARDLAREGCPAFSVVIAGCQSCGRGRLKRVWISDVGGLYFTVILRPDIPAQFSFRVNFAAAVELARLLRQVYHIDAKVKWPNDILADNRKLSGMLSEMAVEGEKISFLNIGIGINVNNTPGEAAPESISLRQLTGKIQPRKELLTAFLDALELRLAQDDLSGIVTEWKEMTLTLGRQVKVVTLQDQFSGLATDVDDHGALILTLPDGSLQRVLYGDCFHGDP